jgi:hypothetical protein
MKYVYTVWFRDPSLPEDDQDHEWPACFVIDGDTESSARLWGDRLSLRYAGETGNEMMHSNTESFDASELPGIDKLPIVPMGHDATDEEIGW